MALQVRRVVTGHDETGRAVIKIDEMSVPALAHDDKNRRRLFLKQSARQNWCGDFSAMVFCCEGIIA